VSLLDVATNTPAGKRFWSKKVQTCFVALEQLVLRNETHSDSGVDSSSVAPQHANIAQLCNVVEYNAVRHCACHHDGCTVTAPQLDGGTVPCRSDSTVSGRGAATARRLTVPPHRGRCHHHVHEYHHCLEYRLRATVLHYTRVFDHLWIRQKKRNSPVNAFGLSKAEWIEQAGFARAQQLQRHEGTAATP
jgi:hypothetical protein